VTPRGSESDDERSRGIGGRLDLPGRGTADSCGRRSRARLPSASRRVPDRTDAVIVLTIYSRPECHLCDDMKAIVRRVAPAPTRGTTLSRSISPEMANSRRATARGAGAAREREENGEVPGDGGGLMKRLEAEDVGIRLRRGQRQTSSSALCPSPVCQVPSALFSGDHKVSPPVLLPAGLGCLVAERLLLALAAARSRGLTGFPG
jgi:hypothetical protein